MAACLEPPQVSGNITRLDAPGGEGLLTARVREEPFVDVSGDEPAGVGGDQREAVGGQAREVRRDLLDEGDRVDAPQFRLDGGIRDLGGQDIRSPGGVLSVEATGQQETEQVLE